MLNSGRKCKFLQILAIAESKIANGFQALAAGDLHQGFSKTKRIVANGFQRSRKRQDLQL